MTILPELPYTGDIQQRVAQQMADVQRRLNDLLSDNGGLPPGYVTGTNIEANTITANNIVSGTITSNEIAAGTIVATNIASGAITTGLLAANAVTAAKIAANTITAGQIAANTITSTELSSTAIDGMTVTGATFQTSATANTTGAGVVITTLGISAYDATHTRQVYIDATTGLIQARGVLLATTGSDIPTATISGLLPGSNRYSNSNFQQGQALFDTTGWTFTGGTAADGGTTVQPVYGARTLQLTATAAAVSVNNAAATDPYRRVLPGLNYTFSHYVYNAAGATRLSRVDVAWYDTSGSFLSLSSGTAVLTPSGQWTRVSQTFQAPINAAYAQTGHYVVTNAVSGDVFYVNALQMEEGDRVSAYAPRSDEVLVNQINASHINVADLSAINSHLGTIVSGSVTSVSVSASTITGTTITTTSGGVIQTATSGDRAWMDSTGFNLASGTNTTPPNVDRISFREQSGNTQVASIYNWYIASSGASILNLGASAAGGAGGIHLGVSNTLMALDQSGTGGAAGSTLTVATVDTSALLTFGATVLDGAGQSSFVQVAGGVASSGSGAPKAMSVNMGSGLVTVLSGANSATVTGIAHGLGVQPIGVFVNSPSQINTIIPVFGRAANIGTTTFDISVFSLNLATATSNQTVGYEWIAIG